MDKSVLVIELPDDYKDGIYKDEASYIILTKDGKGYYGGYAKIKPLPEKIDISSMKMSELWERRNYAYGWNDCLEAITGETE